MASDNEGYWSRSWGLLTRDKGWFKPVLVMAAAQLVPIVGAFGVSGYGLEWARLTAWGVDSAPKQKGVDVGACIGSGARAFVVALGYGLVVGLLNWVIRSVFGEVLGGILSMVIAIFAGVLITVAQLRATIYQSIGAGFEFSRLSDMVKRDHQGLLRVVGMMAILGITLSVVSSTTVTGVLFANMGGLVSRLIASGSTSALSDEEIVRLVFVGLGSALPALAVLGYILGIGLTISNLLSVTAVGLWMRQFDVRNWGESHDPLPDTAYNPTASSSWQGSAQQAPYDTQQAAHDARWSEATSATYPQTTETYSQDVPQPVSPQGVAPEQVTSFPLPVPADEPGDGYPSGSSPTRVQWDDKITEVTPFPLNNDVTTSWTAPSEPVAEPTEATPQPEQEAPAAVEEAAPEAETAMEPVIEPGFESEPEPEPEPATTPSIEPEPMADESEAEPEPEVAVEPEPETVPPFTFDPEPTSGSVPTFALDSDPEPTSGSVPTFALDSEPETVSSVPTFTLDAALNEEPAAEPLPAPEPEDDPEPFEILGVPHAPAEPSDEHIVEVIDLTGSGEQPEEPEEPEGPEGPEEQA